MPTRRAIVAAALIGAAGRARAASPIRVGLLRFGTASWELDCVRRQGLAPGLDIVPTLFAVPQAAQVALQAGAVDVIVQDWLWVSRLRVAGQDWTFAPFSTAVGAVMAPPGGPVRQLSDLVGRRLGVAGSPLDKSWLILRAYGLGRGIALDTQVLRSFGAPPLLSEQLKLGRLDAVLTYWPAAARLEAEGMARVLGIEDAVAGLGIPERVPFTGYVFSAAWAARAGGVGLFLDACARARTSLAQSDAAWDAIAPLTGAATLAEATALRAAFGAGIPAGEMPVEAAGRIYAVLARLGGAALVGDAAQIAPGTFWARPS